MASSERLICTNRPFLLKMSAPWTVPHGPFLLQVTSVCCAWVVTDITMPLAGVDGSVGTNQKWTSLSRAPGFIDDLDFTVLLQGAENKRMGRREEGYLSTEKQRERALL